MALEVLLAIIGLAVPAATFPLASFSPEIKQATRGAIAPTIAWDRSSLRQVSDPEFQNAGYARMVELHDGVLLCVYEAEGSVYATRSLDRGDTWGEAIAVARKHEGVNMTVPDVLELQDKSVMVCYNPRPSRSATDKVFAIRTCKSYDGGLTWTDERLVYEAGEKFTDGCWEPAAIQLPGGEIQLFFADEHPFRDHELDDQHIAMLRSRDSGLTWTKEPEVISYKEGGRDGMPVPLLLQNGERVCVIEQTTPGAVLQPAIIRSSRHRDWKGTVTANSRHREEPLRGQLRPGRHAGAPYIRQLSTGETILSYQGTEGRQNRVHRATMRVWVGDSRARNFANETIPFDVPPDRFAIWNSVNVLKDDTIVALTSTTAFSRRGQVWMMKGRLTKSPLGEALEEYLSTIADTLKKVCPTGDWQYCKTTFDKGTNGSAS